MMFSWDLPYGSRRSPVLARNVVATSQPLAVQAGLSMLQRGGNATDAAVAAAIALTVVEPCSNGIGGDLFAMVWDGQGLQGLNGSGRAPRAWNRERFDHLEGITVGPQSVTVPGAVDAWAQLSGRFGNLPFAQLFEPACQYAAEGFAVSPIVGHTWGQAVDTYHDSDDFRRDFLPAGRPPAVGERFILRGQSETLQQIAESAGESFYRGALARRIVAHLGLAGAAMTAEDLSRHRSEWVAPVAQSYRDVVVHELPPNSQGVAVSLALGILQQLDLAQHPVDSADSVHLQVEAMKAAFREVRRHVADPDHMQVSVAELLHEEALAGHAATIDLDRAGDPESGLGSDGGTVYVTAADESGMMVSLIQSNYWGFGSGLVVRDAGISLHNRGAGFSLEPGHPNLVAGGKRPFHTIIPGFVTRDGDPVMSFGVMGGHMQAQGHVQMVTRIFDYGQNPQAAADAPRWFLDDRLRLVFESGFPAAVREELRRRGHAFGDQPPRFAFGGAQLIYRLENGVYCAASDPRKDGHAAGF
jgi:gamma-glutamyltranspeptidase/glutathione hydrolase